MAARINLANVAIVLVQPNISENIGAAARAMCNMGLRRLVLVDPPRCDLTRVCKMATHAALDVVEAMEIHPGLPEALKDFGYVVGTTARLGGERQAVRTPARLAESLLPIAQENPVAVLFGPEDRGLTNEDLRFCHSLVTIPTADFSSLNLAQAVMVICYELFRFSTAPPAEFAPRLANRFELDAMYAHLTDVLTRICFIDPSNPERFMNNLRHFGTRMQLRAKEVQIIRGICRQIDWYGRSCFAQGRKSRSGGG
ncbi:MAG: RNA methyltransferase [Desulfobacterales bacterium]|jgi:tRNA/rRNA methyltransferase|nr:RNA methyltransferase [Desulfobacterales bacterium]